MTKDGLRARIWTVLRARRVARFPFPIEDRIPNFSRAERAAARAAELPEWKAARRLKMNPDAAQRPLRAMPVLARLRERRERRRR
ncbi:MAG: hypothetical protein HYU51_19625 [Candidatus Rokubacteria bacterium]|nr:hypothetical protein [Candidatus Rokubacteria bacterium]